MGEMQNNKLESVKNINPNIEYATIGEAFDFFNNTLFNGILPIPVFTLPHVAKNTQGYFWFEKFSDEISGEKFHEIALNADAIGKSQVDKLSCLVHEQCHLSRVQEGKKPSKGYHDCRWVEIMRECGLEPVSLDYHPNGTGYKVSHKIIEGGAFDLTCKKFLETKRLRLTSISVDESRARKISKQKFSCPNCGLAAWAKPSASLNCGREECFNQKMLIP